MKILVAADGSIYTKRMLAYLAAHDELLGPAHQYTVLHCTQHLPPGAALYLDDEAQKSYYDKAPETVFKPIRPFFKRHGMQASFVGKIGHPGDVIATVAEKGKYDLLVMGSRGHGTLASLVMGSVATAVLAGCTVPVLIVR